MDVFLFILGTIFGSFICVVAMRYDADRFIGDARVIGGRSRCASCGHTLRWFELIPLVSFLIQLGRCRSCKARIDSQHCVVEVLSGILFVAIPASIASAGVYLHQAPLITAVVSAVWIMVFMILLLITLIDIRLSIIPDETQIVLAILGIVLGVLEGSHFVIPHGSFLGGYGFLFGGGDVLWVKQLLGCVVGAGLLGSLVVITKGRGMGMGDVKLAAVLGLVFGWPDIVVLLGLAFIVGSLYALIIMVRKQATFQSAVPFGPFIASGAFILFFAGSVLARSYFGLLT